MKSLSDYIQERLKDHLAYFIGKAILPDNIVKTFEYILDIFKVIVDKSSIDYCKEKFVNIDAKNTKDLIKQEYLVLWKDVKNDSKYIKIAETSWDDDCIDEDDYVIVYGDRSKKFTIIPFVVGKQSLYSAGCAYRDDTLIHTKDEMWKYLVEPAEKLIK